MLGLSGDQPCQTAIWGPTTRTSLAGLVMNDETQYCRSGNSKIFRSSVPGSRDKIKWMFFIYGPTAWKVEAGYMWASQGFVSPLSRCLKDRTQLFSIFSPSLLQSQVPGQSTGLSFCCPGVDFSPIPQPSMGSKGHEDSKGAAQGDISG